MGNLLQPAEGGRQLVRDLGALGVDPFRAALPQGVRRRLYGEIEWSGARDLNPGVGFRKYVKPRLAPANTRSIADRSDKDRAPCPMRVAGSTRLSWTRNSRRTDKPSSLVRE